MRPAERLLTFEQVAERLAVKSSFLRKLIFSKRIPVVRVGRCVRFRPAELEQWLAERSTPAREQ